ncbi:hypothetical protein FOZ60_008392 [Perkinsus olseni]|uniref:TIR domain-containing protein n=1 Tax=Perkinsus olseni TaxID=32597 RepID=A0A7J6NJG4_PEROL|nr:hypothetical protein FOZ60_008392 [Perkinsus olseni]
MATGPVSSVVPIHNVLLEEGTPTYPGLRGTLLSNLAWHTTFLRDCGIQPDALDSSFPVSRLDIFLSHSWSSSGLWKQVALIVSFYLPFAFKWMVWSSFPLAGLVSWVVDSVNLSEVLLVSVGFGAFLSGLFVSRIFKHNRTTVFLDKCCISQVDPVERMHGISRLSEYLRISDKFVILWSPDYFKRLWCVYELACFLQTHNERDVIVIHPGHVMFCTWMALLALFSLVISRVSQIYLQDPHGSIFYPHVLLWISTCVFVGRYIPSCVGEAENFYRNLRTFRTINAKCSNSEDEVHLEGLIREAYGSLEYFEAVVRGIWLGAEESSQAPYWLFSRTTLKILCVPHIPHILGGLILTVPHILRGSWQEWTDIIPRGHEAEPPPTILRLIVAICLPDLVQRILLGCQAPLLLLLGYHLGLRCTRLPWCCRGLVVSFCCLAYSFASLVLSDVLMYNLWDLEDTYIDRLYSVFIYGSGVALALVVMSSLRRSYSYDLAEFLQ